MASSHDENHYPLHTKMQPVRNTAIRQRSRAPARAGVKLPFGAVLLPLIALATFGQIASIDRISAYFPDLFFYEAQGPAYPATPVVSQILPPLTAVQPAPASAAPGMRILTVTSGDTLQSLLTEGGVSWDEAQRAVAAIGKFFDPRDLHAGQQLDVMLHPAQSGAELARVSIKADVDRVIVAQRQENGGFAGREVINPLTQTSRLVSGRIESSLFEAAIAANIRPEIVVELIRLFSYDVDFQRDIQPGDSFDVLYDRDIDAQGRVARTGAIRYAALTIGNERKELFRFAPGGGSGGEAGYFNSKGHAAQKAIMKTPVDGGKLSSRFGMRRHPILGYTRMHKGLDFAIPTGTPVMAAGQGFVEMAGWNGAYGKYIRIRHNDGYSTAYAHLSGLGKGIRKGARVKQGQIIGYSGSTGRSTGPHLHYEVLVNGAQVNPQNMALPTAHALTGRELEQFRQLRDAIGAERVALGQATIKAASF